MGRCRESVIQEHSLHPQQTQDKNCSKMSKLLLCCAVLLAIALLAPSASAKDTKSPKKKGQFLTQLCEKCKYCETDPECSGCSECAKCETKNQEGCRFCRAKEDEGECKERCRKGCGICGGKDGTGLDSCKKINA